MSDFLPGGYAGPVSDLARRRARVKWGEQVSISHTYTAILYQLERHSPVALPRTHFMAMAPLDVWLRMLWRGRFSITPKYWLRLAACLGTVGSGNGDHDSGTTCHGADPGVRKTPRRRSYPSSVWGVGCSRILSHGYDTPPVPFPLIGGKRRDSCVCLAMTLG